MKLIPGSLTLVAFSALGWGAVPAVATDELRWHVCHKLNYVSSECATLEEKPSEAKPPAQPKFQEEEKPAEKVEPLEASKGPAVPSPRPPWYFVNPDATPAMQAMLSKENPTEEDAEKAIEELMLIMNRTNMMTELLYRAGIKKGFVVPPVDDFSTVRMGGPEGGPSRPGGVLSASGSGPGGGEDVMIPYYASKPTLLYFYNPSCHACAQTTPELLSLDAATRHRVDIVAVVATPEQVNAAGAFPFRLEVRPDLYAVLDVDRTPTFVMFDRDTKKAARWSGVTSGEEFRYWIGAVLAERDRHDRARPGSIRRRRGIRPGPDQGGVRTVSGPGVEGNGR